jgi:hypothetical protein
VNTAALAVSECPVICFRYVVPLLRLLANAAVYVKHVASTCDEALRSCKQSHAREQGAGAEIPTVVHPDSPELELDSLHTNFPFLSHRIKRTRGRADIL